MRQGFKTEAERISLAEREALGLTERCRLDPLHLADAKSVGVVALAKLPGVSPEHVARLREDDPAAFSAAAVVHDSRALIVVNDAHTVERQANSISHEIAHILLDHKPTPAFGKFGARTLSKTEEDEADWLAGCLLVPGSGITATMTDCGGNLKTAAGHYGVSIELMRWRHNMTRRQLSEPARSQM
jgi:Zn-dependent peptidase ImmA (M78 family)